MYLNLLKTKRTTELMYLDRDRVFLDITSVSPEFINKDYGQQKIRYTVRGVDELFGLDADVICQTSLYGSGIFKILGLFLPRKREISVRIYNYSKCEPYEVYNLWIIANKPVSDVFEEFCKKNRLSIITKKYLNIERG